MKKSVQKYFFNAGYLSFVILKMCKNNMHVICLYLMVINLNPLWTAMVIKKMQAMFNEVQKSSPKEH